MAGEVLIVGVILSICLIANALHHVPDGETLLIYRSERPYRWAGPGTALVVPLLERTEPCSSTRRRYAREITVFSSDRVRFTVPVVLMWRVVNPVAYHPIDEIHRTRIVSLLAEAVTHVANRHSAAEMVLACESMGLAVGQQLAPRLDAVGIEMVGITVSTPALPEAMESALSRHPAALAARPGFIAEALTHALVVSLEVASAAKELEDLGDRAYDAHTRRIAAEKGAPVLLPQPPSHADEDDTGRLQVVTTPVGLARSA